MPYIPASTRETVDPVLDPLLDLIRRLQSDMVTNPLTPSILGYIYFKLLMTHAERPGRGRFMDIASAIGTLDSAKMEFYRRHVIPYEDIKKSDNGDTLPC